MLSDGVLLKLEPVMVTLAPTGPFFGVKDKMEGICPVTD
jgi:hypothetical protein